MSRWLIIAGAILILAGLLWPWITRLGLGHLPGDIHIKREGSDFYFPLTTSIVISLLLSLLLWLFRR